MVGECWVVSRAGAPTITGAEGGGSPMSWFPFSTCSQALLSFQTMKPRDSGRSWRSNRRRTPRAVRCVLS